MTPSNRARLLVLLSFLVVIGIAFAFWPHRVGVDAGEIIAWLFYGEVAFVIGVYVNSYRQEHHLTWREVLPRVIAVGVTYAVVVGGVTIPLWVYFTTREHWQTVGPILEVVGVFIAALGIVLLVLYLVVRVVRAAWKH